MRIENQIENWVCRASYLIRGKIVVSTAAAAFAIYIPAEAATIFAENMGTPSGTTAISANTFQNSGTLTYSGTADVRNTTVSSGYTGASGGGNVFFTSTSGINFQIASINTLNYSSFGLTFGVNKLTNASSVASDLPITFSTSGGSGSVIYPAQTTGSSTTGWRLITASSVPLIGSRNLAIKFTNTVSTTSASFRLDDVTLTGTLRTANTTLVWNGAAANGNWFDGNWSGNNAPINGDALQFAGSTQTATTNDINNLTVASITFNSGAGAFTLGGNALAVAGDITNNSTTLQTVGTPLSLGASQNVNAASGALTFSSTATISLGANTLTFNGANAANVSGAVSGTGGSVSQSGNGTTTLSATSNSYSGTTTVSAGTLKLAPASGTNNIASSSKIVVGTTVGSTAVLDTTAMGTTGLALASSQVLAGTGTVSGNVTVASGSVITAGTGAAIPSTAGAASPEVPGTLASGNQTWNSGGKYVWKTTSSTGTAGTTWDLLNMAVLAGSSGFTVQTIIGTTSGSTAGTFNLPAAGDPGDPVATYKIAHTTNTSAIDVSGFILDTSLLGLPSGVYASTLSFDPASGGGYDLNLNFTAAPEPTAAALLGMGLSPLLGRRRRREGKHFRMTFLRAIR